MWRCLKIAPPVTPDVGNLSTKFEYCMFFVLCTKDRCFTFNISDPQLLYMLHYNDDDDDDDDDDQCMLICIVL